MRCTGQTCLVREGPRGGVLHITPLSATASPVTSDSPLRQRRTLLLAPVCICTGSEKLTQPGSHCASTAPRLLSWCRKGLSAIPGDLARYVPRASLRQIVPRTSLAPTLHAPCLVAQLCRWGARIALQLEYAAVSKKRSPQAPVVLARLCVVQRTQQRAAQ